MECIQFLCPLHYFFQRAIPLSFSWECSHGSASRLSGSQEGSLLFSHCDDLKQCRCSFLAIPPSISPTSSSTSRGCIHVAVSMLLHTSLQCSPHLLMKLFSLLALPKEIFCKTQVLVLGSNMRRSPFPQVFFSQTLLC